MIVQLLKRHLHHLELWRALIEEPSQMKYDFFMVNILSPDNFAKVDKQTYTLKVDQNRVGNLLLFRDSANMGTYFGMFRDKFEIEWMIDFAPQNKNLL